MTKNPFTQQEIDELAANLFTSKVNENSITFTIAFKSAFWELYQKGFKPSQILIKLGYRPEILGYSRIVGISQKIRNEALSDTGFLGKRDKRLLEQLSEDEASALSDKQVITKLQGEVAFLRQEIEFVKKIINSDNTDGQKK